MTFFGPSMTEKNHGRSKGEEYIGEFPVTVGASPSDAWRDCAFLFYTYACGCEAWGEGVLD